MSDKKAKKSVTEMGAGGVAGFQLPLGIKQRKEALDRCIRESGDLNEGHALLYLRSLDESATEDVCEALDFRQYEHVASMIREHAVREVVRGKIREVVRKKKGGGGFVLYAPNKGKKKPSHPVGVFPTKLAAKRAELARFPPKDPKRLQRLRKEIDKLMKDPEKRAEAERRAMQQKGTDEVKPLKATKRESYSREMVEAALISKIMLRDVRAAALREGLFREEAQASEWDDYIKKISDKALKGDKGFQRAQAQVAKATETALAQAMKVIQKQLGQGAKVRGADKPGATDGGQVYVPFSISAEAADIGPIYLYVDKGVPAIEMSDAAKSNLVKVSPESAKSIRAALAAAQDVLEKMDTVRAATMARDSYLSKLEDKVDKMIMSMTPLQVSLLKQLLVKKYRGLTK